MRSPAATMSTCLACLVWWAPAAEAEVKFTLEGGVHEGICRLTVEDIKGSYTIPYIQSARDLTARIEWRGEAESAAIVLLKGAQEVERREAQRPAETITFECQAPGEYDIEARSRNLAGAETGRTALRRIGIGTVLAAIGDSITEGGCGHGFWRESLDLKADMFPPCAVSKDGRNFPQFSPTTQRHEQVAKAVWGKMVNCLQSWMTPLNEGLAGAWKQPVFIANEGWGGTTSGSYLQMMQKDQGWQRRMRQLRPRVWLIHLGVNDERGKVPALQFARNMEAIVDFLIKEHGAAADHIVIAKPCYDYFPGAREILEACGEQIDGLVARRGLKPGPDFFTAYSTDKERWYGRDLVHPNVEGMQQMGRLWLEALVKAFPEGPSK